MAAMTDTPARLLSLLSLLQTPREWPGSELAERLSVTPRTVRRDIERLRSLGYPVHASRGAIGGYRLAAGTAMPPLLLDDEEAVAITVGLRTAAGNAIDGIEEASVRALAKLEQVLPARLRHRVGALSAATVSLADHYGPRVDPEVLTTLGTAVAARERVRFGYRALDGADSKRLVEPYGLVAAGRRWYFVAYDVGRDGWRTFRVDRIAEPRATGARCAPRELPEGDADAAAYVRRTLYALAPVYRAVATLHAPAATVTGRVGDRPGDVEPLDEGSCLLRSDTDTLEWLAIRLLQLNCEFEVHEPPELRAHLRDLGARAGRAAR